MKRKPEKAVQRAAAGIDGCDTCGSQYDMFLFSVLRDVTQESRFTRPRFSGKEQRATGKVNDLEGVLPLLVVQV